MATLTFQGQLFDLVENADGSARSLSSENVSLVVTTSADVGFFNYNIVEQDGELPDVVFSGADNITSATVKGIQVLDVDDVDASLGVISINGADTFTLALNRETGVNQFDLALFALDGADLPTINSASAFNQILSSADFSAGSGSQGPNRRIEFSDLSQAAFEAGDVDPVEPTQNGSVDADVINGDDGDNSINAGGGSDSVNGGSGDDTLLGGGGGDTLVGGKGSDELIGGGGKDLLLGNGGKDLLEGGGGKDNLKGGGGSDTLLGGGGKDIVDGQGGRDRIDGGGGKDIVLGGGGADTLTGGRGRDELTGGRGSDRFEFKRGDGRDTVTDYEDGRDKFIIGLGADDFSDLTINQFGSNDHITFANDRIVVEDTDADVLGANDFLF